jgi:hypothetical protein
MIPMGFIVTSRLFCRAGKIALLGVSVALATEVLSHVML